MSLHLSQNGCSCVLTRTRTPILDGRRIADAWSCDQIHRQNGRNMDGRARTGGQTQTQSRTQDDSGGGSLARGGTRVQALGRRGSPALSHGGGGGGAQVLVQECSSGLAPAHGGGFGGEHRSYGGIRPLSGVQIPTHDGQILALAREEVHTLEQMSVL